MTPLISTLFLAGALQGSLELSDRTEARFTGTTGPNTYSYSAEVMTNPAALLRLDTRRWLISARYAPSLTFRGIGIDPALDILHRGHIEASLEATRRLTVGISGDASYGTLRFLSPELPDAGFASAQPVDALPNRDTINFASLDVGAGATFAATRRLKLEAFAGYGLSGGADAASQEVYPQIAGPRALVRADYAITRRDSSRGAAEAMAVSFSTGQESVLAQVTEAWLHRFNRVTTSTLGLGAALDVSRNSAGEDSRALYPVVDAALTHNLPAKRLELGLNLRVAPVVDRMRGEIEPRALLDASSMYRPSGRLAVWGRAGAAQSLPWSEPDSLTLGYGEAGVGVRLADWVELINGARAAYQFRKEMEPLRLQWMIFSGATFTAPRVRF